MVKRLVGQLLFFRHIRKPFPVPRSVVPAVRFGHFDRWGASNFVSPVSEFRFPRSRPSRRASPQMCLPVPNRIFPPAPRLRAVRLSAGLSCADPAAPLLVPYPHGSGLRVRSPPVPILSVPYLRAPERVRDRGTGQRRTGDGRPGRRRRRAGKAVGEAECRCGIRCPQAGFSAEKRTAAVCFDAKCVIFVRTILQVERP